MSSFACLLSSRQYFKDHLRTLVKDHPGWVNVFPGQSQSQKQGWCRLRDKEDADAVFQKYKRSGILVHVWKTCHSNESRHLMKCNYSLYFSRVSDGKHSAELCGIYIGMVNLFSGQTQVVPTNAYVPAPSAYTYAMYPEVRASAANPTSPVYVQQVPVYSASASGIPINICPGGANRSSWGLHPSSQLRDYEGRSGSAIEHVKPMTSTASDIGAGSSLFSNLVFDFGLFWPDGAFVGLRLEVCLGIGGPPYRMI
ncbi:hypothetical protein T440DRAFT_546822 [Plenodomus tracheiphilus IPT5]|uniref:Uncharacterized protein n=1 Tax=Plenodomus tracheiphilus IPT5 TaxID=1408161 RepID=A0A6A7AQ90_9PLEO|nr:hypothetical protein T440DRAFT_546822 [Plenodomus tracheiphilus IPT5]